jgi:hypothetical protein
MKDCRVNPALALVAQLGAECAVNKEFARTVRASCFPNLTSVLFFQQT